MSDTPICDQLAAEFRARRHARDEWGLPGGGAHQWRTEPDTEEVPVARHGDDDGDGLANQADPDWVPPLTSEWTPEVTYEFPDPGWRPESDFTGEWIDELVAHNAAGGATS